MTTDSDRGKSERSHILNIAVVAKGHKDEFRHIITG